MTKTEATELALKYIENAIPVSIVGRHLKNDADVKLFHKCYLEQLQTRKLENVDVNEIFKMKDKLDDDIFQNKMSEINLDVMRRLISVR